MREVNLIVFLLLITIIVCNEKSTHNINNGLFHSFGNSPRKMIIRSGPQWQFKVDGNNGLLTYLASNGFRNFNLAVNLEVKKKVIHVYFDSIISYSELASSVIKEFKKGELIFEYLSFNDSLTSNSAFFKQFSSNTESTVFQLITDSNFIDTTTYRSSVNFKKIEEYLGRREYRKKKVLVVPCYNGYEYAQLGYNFNPFLEKKLSKIDTITFIPFPLKKMLGSGYQSVYDKKYCAEIIMNTNADYLIMTRFTGNVLDIKATRRIWGYETKILNVKTMKQVISIKANNLNSYEEIEIDISKNLKKLVSDILTY